MKLWLDDVRPAPDGWVWCKCITEAIDVLETGRVEEISFDHDLGHSVHSGYDVAVWIERKSAMEGLKPMRWEIHSANPVGRGRIEMAMKGAERFWNHRTIG